MEALFRISTILLIVALDCCLIHGHENTFEDVVHMDAPADAAPHAHEADTPPVPHVHEARPDSSRFNRNHIQNQEHILEHLDGVIKKPEEEMTEDELQFHYFKLHDYDNNNELDGIEIIDAMTHYHKGDKPDDHEHEERMSDEELMSIVDQIMEDEDQNNDGYIGYSEFVTAQRSQDKPTQT